MVRLQKRSGALGSFKSIGFIGLLTLIIGVTVYLINQQQDFRQRASEIRSIYVGPGGDDNNDGSTSRPLASISKAAEIATPGTTIHVAEGTYHETLITHASGTQDQRIRFVSDKKWGAKIVSAGNELSTNATWENNGNYIDIVGFDISGGERIGIANRGSFVNVSGNRIHDIANGYCLNKGGAGLLSAYSQAQRNNRYEGNLIERVGPKPCSYVHGIYVQSLQEVVVNNIVLNNGGIGIACTHGCNEPVIANNTILNNGYGIRVGWSQSNTPGKTNNALIVNNIVAGHQGYTVYQYLPGLGENNVFSNNLFYGNKTNSCLSPTGSTPIECKNTITSDPILVNFNTTTTSYDTSDFHLTSTSPAINAGLAVSDINTDFDGNQRPAGAFDIGAYEFTVATPPPASPPITEPPATTPPSPTPTPGKLFGDSDNDGKLDIKDYIFLTRCLRKNTTPCAQADLNGDKKVTVSDLNILLRELFKRKR